jgi:hypothetical protein
LSLPRCAKTWWKRRWIRFSIRDCALQAQPRTGQRTQKALVERTLKKASCWHRKWNPDEVLITIWWVLSLLSLVVTPVALWGLQRKLALVTVRSCCSSSSAAANDIEPDMIVFVPWSVLEFVVCVVNSLVTTGSLAVAKKDPSISISFLFLEMMAASFSLSALFTLHIVITQVFLK